MSTESEYVRGSECQRIVLKSGQCINSMRDEIIEEKKKNIALDRIIRELAEKHKLSVKEIDRLEDELDYYRGKSNKKVSASLSEKSLNTLLDKKDEYIMKESHKGVDELVEVLRKKYL